MAIAFDAAASTAGEAITHNWSHTCTGSDLVLIVFFSYNDDEVGSDISSVTYNGVGMNQVFLNETDFQFGIACYQLVAPATGLNTVSVTFLNSEIAALGSISLTGVDQTTPTPTSASVINPSGASGPGTVNITTQNVNSWLVDMCCLKDKYTDQIPAVNSSQTSRWDNGTSGNPSAAQSTARAATRAVTTAQQYSSSFDWPDSARRLHGVIEVKEKVVAGYKKAIDAGAVSLAVDGGVVQNAYTD